MERPEIAQSTSFYLTALAAFVLLGIVFAAAGIIAHCRAKKHEKTATTFTWTLAAVFCFAAAAFAFITNFGIYRVLLLLILLPVWYSVLFFFSTINSAAVLKNRPLAVIMRIATCICYVASSILLEDSASEGNYIMFGMFKPGSYWKIFHTAAIVTFAAAMLLMIAQIIWSCAANVKNKNRSSFVTQEDRPASYLTEPQPDCVAAADDAVINKTEDCITEPLTEEAAEQPKEE